jgi:probable phosphoglycerate mutase
MNNKLTTFYMVRHGETEWNKTHLIQGHTDIQLTAQGEDQARKLAQELKDVDFDEVFSSDLVRAKRTAEIIALEKNLSIVTTEALRERFYGQLQGKASDEFKKLFKQVGKITEEIHWQHIFADEESWHSLMIRYTTFLRETAVAYPGKTILVVSHHGILGSFLVKLGYWTWENRGKFENCGYIIVESDGVDFFLKDIKGLKKQQEVPEEPEK